MNIRLFRHLVLRSIHLLKEKCREYRRVGRAKPVASRRKRYVSPTELYTDERRKRIHFARKCDETQPTCARCTRLNIPCVGSGQRRYKFKEELGFQQNPKKGRKPQSKGSSKSPSETGRGVVPVAPSSNGTALLARAFIETIRGSTDLRYNLGWAYGFYLYDIPQRLGTNKALDASVEAMVTAHSSFCLKGFVSVETLVKYSRALSVLRTYLDDPVKAHSSDTLGAVALLLTCQVSTHFCTLIVTIYCIDIIRTFLETPIFVSQDMSRVQFKFSRLEGT